MKPILSRTAMFSEGLYGRGGVRNTVPRGVGIPVNTEEAMAGTPVRTSSMCQIQPAVKKQLEPHSEAQVNSYDLDAKVGW